MAARLGPDAWQARLDAWLEPFLAAPPRVEQLHHFVSASPWLHERLAKTRL